jgi:hypothetical protein
MNHNKCVGHVSHLEHMIRTRHNSADRPQSRCEDVIKVNIKEISACALDTRHSHILLNLKIHYCALQGR